MGCKHKGGKQATFFSYLYKRRSYSYKWGDQNLLKYKETVPINLTSLVRESPFKCM